MVMKQHWSLLWKTTRGLKIGPPGSQQFSKPSTILSIWPGFRGCGKHYFPVVLFLPPWPVPLGIRIRRERSKSLLCGMPQSSGLFLFKIYMQLLGEVIHWQEAKYHQYADDIQLYILVLIRQNDLELWIWRNITFDFWWGSTPIDRTGLQLWILQDSWLLPERQMRTVNSKLL